MSDTNDTVILQALDEAGTRVAPEDLTRALRGDFQDVASRGDTYWKADTFPDNTRLNYWEGQKEDGRLWSSQLGKKAKPFNGCSDQRVWMVDLIIKAKVAFTMEVLTRAEMAVLPLTKADGERAQRVEILLKWIRRNLWKSRGRRQMKVVQNWTGTDGNAALYSAYDRKMLVTNELATVDSIVQDYLVSMEAPQEGDDLEAFAEEQMIAGQRVAMLLYNPDAEPEESLDVLRTRFPNLSDKRLKSMLKDLKDEGQTLAPVPMPAQEGPRPTALRVGVDIFFEPGVDDIQEAPVIYLVSRLSRAQALVRAKQEEWDEAFTLKLLGDPEESEGGQWGTFTVTRIRATEDGSTREQDETDDDDLVEVVTALRKAVDDEGKEGVYRMVFHPAIEVPATDDELLEDTYGNYPIVVFWREVLSSRILDSRGWPEVAGPAQSLVKWLRDMAVNVTSLSTLPPLVAPVNRAESELVVAPLSVMRERRPKDIRVFNEFKYPKEAMDLANLIEEHHDRLAALSYKDDHRMITEVLQQDETKDVLCCMEDFFGLVVQQTLHHMSPEKLEEITGGPIDVTPQELLYRVGVTLSFDPRHMDKEFVKSWLETMSTLILPNDPRNVVLRDELARIGTRLLDPSLGDRLTRDTEDAGRQEVKEEEDQIARILMGFDPELLEYQDGADFQARFDVLQQWMDGNPDRIAQLDESTRERMLMHYQNLQQQLQQQQNVNTGRTGVNVQP